MKIYPKIGIRPTIDARQGGVRESLEEKTMNLAKSVAQLISSNLRNGDGSPVECVIADTTIGRVGESAACAAKFEREGVGSTITVTSCWCYGSETMDMNPHYPKAVWGFNGTERPGAVYLAAVLAAHAQKGLPAFGPVLALRRVIGLPQAGQDGGGGSAAFNASRCSIRSRVMRSRKPPSRSKSAITRSICRKRRLAARLIITMIALAATYGSSCSSQSAKRRRISIMWRLNSWSTSSVAENSSNFSAATVCQRSSFSDHTN